MYDSAHAEEESQAEEPARRSRLRPLLLGALVGLAITASASFLIYVARGERIPRLTESDYEAAVARWEKNGPADYDLDLELAGSRPGPVHVEVRQGQVTHMTRDGVVPRQKRTWEAWSVPGQFDTIERDLEMALDPAGSFNVPGATQVVQWAEFDPKFGYPKQYHRVVLGADFEVEWKVTRFEIPTAKN